MGGRDQRKGWNGATFFLGNNVGTTEKRENIMRGRSRPPDWKEIAQKL